jgi:exodeoxyribonuclease-1
VGFTVFNAIGERKLVKSKNRFAIFTIRFDDEFTRYSLYRNFIDPYAWHWKNGNTRWDILDVVRLCYALKKETSLKWVYDENGKPIFRLDQLSLANGIEHSEAHDALADVRATIAIAKIIQDTQPQLFEYAFSLRQKKTVEQKIKLFEPMLHTSGMYPATLSCTRLAVANVPTRIAIFPMPSIRVDKISIQ